MPKENKINESLIYRTLNHTKYYVTNVFGGSTDHDFRFELLNEKIQQHKKGEWKYISDSMIILTPIGAKRLFEELKKSLGIWENEKGKIDIPKKSKRIIKMK